MLKPNSIVTNNLIKARELIADEKNWCQHALKRDGKHCAIGALVALEAWTQEMSKLLTRAAYQVHSGPQSQGALNALYVNNFMGHKATMTMFDRAIELSLQEPTPQ